MLKIMQLCISCIVVISLLAVACKAESDAKIDFGEIAVSVADSNVVEIDLPSTASFRDFALADPGRVVIDLKSVNPNKRSLSKQIASGPVHLVRLGQHEDYVRLVLETTSEDRPVYSIEAKPNKLMVSFGAPTLANTEAVRSSTTSDSERTPLITAVTAKSRLTWTRNSIGLIFRNSGDSTLVLDQCAVCTSSCADLPRLALDSSAEQGIEAAPEARISCIIKDSSRSERLVITPQDGNSGEL